MFDDKGKWHWRHKVIKSKHSEYANWGKILLETISFFGDSCDYNKSYYHGLDKTFLFRQHITKIHGPLSTVIVLQCCKKLFTQYWNDY